jgi:hypothetical protein
MSIELVGTSFTAFVDAGTLCERVVRNPDVAITCRSHIVTMPDRMAFVWPSGLCFETVNPWREDTKCPPTDREEPPAHAMQLKRRLK